MKSLERALGDAWERKSAGSAGTDALRLLNADASGMPGLVAELFGAHLVAYAYDGRWAEVVERQAGALLRTFGWQSVILKDRAAAGDAERGGSRVVAGEAPPRVAVREGPLHFWVEPNHPRNVGLFLDTRGWRDRLRAQSESTRVLNLFSYTCSLGLAALSGGAVEVVNVDVSSRYLAWGRENLRLNALPERARFMRISTERYLDWAAGKGSFFQLVIFDPPVFARHDGGRFRFADDYFRLAAKCAACLAPQGRLFAATNYAGLSPATFAARLRTAVHIAGRRIGVLDFAPLPPDFEVADPANRPAGNSLLAEITLE